MDGPTRMWRPASERKPLHLDVELGADEKVDHCHKGQRHLYIWIVSDLSQSFPMISFHGGQTATLLAEPSADPFEPPVETRAAIVS